jgi:hypothetical protein
MSGSLRDQLVKAGLVTKEKANLAGAKSRKKSKGKRHNASAVSTEVDKATQEKRERDRQLNAEREAKKQAEAQRAAIKQQIKQLIEGDHVEKYQGEIAHNYQAGNRIKQVFVTEAVHKQLADGALGVTRLNGKTFIVPRAVAEKVTALNPDYLVALNRPDDEKDSDPDDPYAGYEVPDDLMW